MEIEISVTVTLPERYLCISGTGFVSDVLEVFAGREINCADIRGLLQNAEFDEFENVPFIKGFVTILSRDAELQVAAVYTALHGQ